MSYSVTNGAPLAIDKWVIRKDGLLVRNAKGEPLLFDTLNAANEHVERLRWTDDCERMKGNGEGF